MFYYIFILSVQALILMMKIPVTIIRLGLFFNIATSITIVVIGIMRKNIFLDIFGFGTGGWSIAFAALSWRKLGFIAENLRTALLSISFHIELFCVAFIQLILLLSWTVWWVYTTVGIINASTLNYCDDWECEQFRDWASILILIVSFIWTYQVIKVSSFQFIEMLMCKIISDYLIN